MRLLAFGDRAQEDHPHIDEVGLLRRARGVGGSPGRRGGDQPQKDCTRGSGGGGRQRPPRRRARAVRRQERSEEHTSELQSLMRISYAVFCLKNKKKKQAYTNTT